MKEFMKYNFVIDRIRLACLVKAGTGATVHKNRASHGLALFTGGERWIVFPDRKIKVGKNTIVYFPQGSDYIVKDREIADCYAINFWMADGASFEPFAFKVKNYGAYLESFKSAQNIWAKKKTGRDAKVKAELYNVIYNMQAEYDIPYSRVGVIGSAVEYVHSNYYKENISVAKLADLCSISEAHLRNTFTKVFAMSPVRYINHLKMSRACELLSSGLYTVSEVCFLAGYNDESYFSREFKKHYGKSPKEYVKASR